MAKNKNNQAKKKTKTKGIQKLEASNELTNTKQKN